MTAPVAPNLIAVDCADFYALSPLEARVLRIAAHGNERPADPEPVSRTGRVLRRATVFALARRPVAPLADARLEALRSYAVAVRTARPRDVAALVAAGYSETLARCIDGFVGARTKFDGAARRARRARWMEAAGIAIALLSFGGFLALFGVMVTMI